MLVIRSECRSPGIDYNDYYGTEAQPVELHEAPIPEQIGFLSPPVQDSDENDPEGNVA